jgi:polyhydroxyalkanoate synthase
MSRTDPGAAAGDRPMELKPFVNPEQIEAAMRDQAAFGANLAQVLQRSQDVWTRFVEHNAKAPAKPPLDPDPLNLAPAFMELGQSMMERPQAFGEAAMRLWLTQAELWRRTTLRMWGLEEQPVVEPSKGDKRFKNEEWSKNVIFDYVKQSYLLTANWIQRTVADADGDLDPREKRKLEFYTRLLVEAMSPANFAATNPEVLRATIEQKGENLVRGLENMLKDLERGKGRLAIRQTDMDAFEVGRNLATTPGQVIFQNELFQLIQYAPTTETAQATPILFIPPWINKFYILDLNEKKSFIRWLVAEGFTVFVISWVNPDARQKDETWESYMEKGVLTALSKALEEAGAKKAHMVGYCIGGTMLGTTLARLAAEKDRRVATATFLTAQLDFTDAGELQVFVDDKQLKAIEGQMQQGYLPASEMANAFNTLRASDLIWGFVVSNYLLGKEPFPFDMLYWNADSTSMPAKVHRYYLESFYDKNRLARCELEIAGVRMDLAGVKTPSYHVATKEDHIAPAPSVYRGARLLGGRDHTFVLAGSGHIAGVVNPPAGGKYQYWARKGLGEPELGEWIEQAEETPGSWWPHWAEWLRAREAEKGEAARVPARDPGARLGRIEPAPGGYVRQRYERR